MSSTIRVIARLVALPDKVEPLKTLLLELVEPTRQEQGCISYELFQNAAAPTDFTFIEEWSSPTDLEAHLASIHIQSVDDRLSELVAEEPDIRRYHLLA